MDVSELVAQLVSEDCIERTPVYPFSPDRDGLIELFQMHFGAFPDLSVTIHDQLEVT